VYVSKLDELEPAMETSSNVFHLFPEVTYPAAQKAMDLLVGGLSSLGNAGLGIDRKTARRFGLGIFETLGVGGITRCLSV
jgi:hypothetical protein